MTVVGFPFVFLPLYFRYRTLRYEFDGEGMSVKWGILFRREINLSYRRIQDIHLTRNVLQRWMGLATIEIQNASGGTQAATKIDGVIQAEALRDFLYSRMRGAHADEESHRGADGDEVLVLLREIRDEMRRRP
ncbi:PH domain-containing protein [Nocardiaceae bacterium YC2-7]|uniref:PH domain-containing protein n=2 Tax=Antrihabitans stalactiti TaxID=2584121 RepID=A0A848KGG5_9NOCA|nr:PH domain-containing protein [Antrihabitans stalactiti]NMN96866.1 PH domain-containing protein [Antrihabitans stalactiti]